MGHIGLGGSCRGGMHHTGVGVYCTSGVGWVM